MVKLTDGASLDYVTTQNAIHGQHYAFLMTEEVCDSLIAKIRDRKVQHWVDPRGQHENQINIHDGGRGVYFQDPSGHYMEGITCRTDADKELILRGCFKPSPRRISSPEADSRHQESVNLD
ncbi:hypothetical protein [Corallococcus exiguus]|uniref:hypothetical protein n=1 Tax=Corallococcus exiguus TaxID=83462 RepID=UPI0020A6A3A0|nr:hypothetical protein [Corallococcus exiguus]